eukprot:COSAG02_NODE_885_length_16178_cov_80.571677_10_plen_67_part_00
MATKAFKWKRQRQLAKIVLNAVARQRRRGGVGVAYEHTCCLYEPQPEVRKAHSDCNDSMNGTVSGE